jgi:hypothetical protein
MNKKRAEFSQPLEGILSPPPLDYFAFLIAGAIPNAAFIKGSEFTLSFVFWIAIVNYGYGYGHFFSPSLFSFQFP